MIHPLRQLHRRTFLAFGLILPAALVIGLAVRPPASFNTGALPPTASVWQRADLFAKAPVQVRLLSAPGQTGDAALVLSAVKDFLKPDLLVYWVAGQPAITDTLPGDAVLLGPFSSPMLPLPAEAVRRSGVLVLYSLADNEITDVSRPVQLNATTSPSP
jgi:hypothetical protein